MIMCLLKKMCMSVYVVIDVNIVMRCVIKLHYMVWLSYIQHNIAWSGVPQEMNKENIFVIIWFLN